MCISDFTELFFLWWLKVSCSANFVSCCQLLFSWVLKAWMSEPSGVMAMDLEGLRSSLPADEGFKLCAELMRHYLAVLSPEDQFTMKLDWVLAWNNLWTFSKFWEMHFWFERCHPLKFNLFKEQVIASTCVCESASATSKWRVWIPKTEVVLIIIVKVSWRFNYK